MTYCVGIKVQEGLVCLADGRITSGSQLSSAQKGTMIDAGEHSFLLMSSGLRSVRDKSLALLRRDLAAGGCRTMLDACSAFCHCLRRVEEEDREALERSKLMFNLHALLCGQLNDDREPQIYLVYPEGNWIEVDRRTPHLAIGVTSYGKPILDRALKHETSLRAALKIAYLSFDSSRFSSNDVGFPFDLYTYTCADRRWRAASFEYDDLVEQRHWWNANITRLAERFPDGPWQDRLLS